VFQLVLPLHECADPTVVEPLHSVAEPLHYVAKPLHSIAEPLYSIADSAAASAAPTETS
jgi:hypothetical protein